MTDSSDMDVFDSITSGNASAEPEVVVTQDKAPEQPAQSRDDGGRFAKTEPAPAPVAEEPAQPHAGHQKGGIPEPRLKAEADKRRAAEDEAAALRREIAELRGMVQAPRQQPEPQAQQEPQQPRSIWDSPEDWMKDQITPVQSQLQETREMLMELQATQKHGAEAVAAAKEAVKSLFNTPEGAALAQRPGNLFDNMVQWHKQQETLSRIGNDPDAFIAAEIERRMNDPVFLSQAMERARSVASSNTNRSQPVTNFAPTLSRLPSGGNAPADGDQSDSAVFSSVTSGRRK